MPLPQLSDDIKYLISSYGYDVAYKLGHVGAMNALRQFPIRLTFHRIEDAIDFTPHWLPIGRDEVSVEMKNGKWILWNYHINRGSFSKESDITEKLLEILNKSRRWGYLAVKLTLTNIQHRAHSMKTCVHFTIDESRDPDTRYTEDMISNYLRQYYECNDTATSVLKRHLPPFHFAQYNGNKGTIIVYDEVTKSFAMLFGLKSHYDDNRFWILKIIFDLNLMTRDCHCDVMFDMYLDHQNTHEKYSFESCISILQEEYDGAEDEDTSNESLLKLATLLQFKLRKRNICRRFQLEIVRGVNELRRIQDLEN